MPDCSHMSITSLVRRMNSAPDFGYDDEGVELTRKLAAQGKDWRWSGGLFDAHVEIFDVPGKAELHLESLKLGDKLVVTVGGVDKLMEVYSLAAPGDMGRRFSAGPRVGAWIRPGGYSVSFDYETLKSASFTVRALTEQDCEGFIADGSCIHSDCMGKAGM